jgi:hypothetical protein
MSPCQQLTVGIDRVICISDPPKRSTAFVSVRMTANNDVAV